MPCRIVIVLSLCMFFAYKKQVPAVFGGCSEDVNAATVFQAELLAQCVGCHGEVPYADVGAVDAGECGFQFALVHGRNGLYGERAAGEIGYGFCRNEQVAVAAYLPCAVPSGYEGEASRLHQ